MIRPTTIPPVSASVQMTAASQGCWASCVAGMGYGREAVPYIPDSGTEIDGDGITSTSRCRRDRSAGRLGATHFPARAP
jgi:hypothetical protein